MKPRKITILVMLLGLLLLAFAAGVAQTPAQGDQKKKAEACCAMESCCCSKGDSCKMHKRDMNHADGHECCSCCADSCDMDMKDHKADCCKAKAKDAKDKNKQCRPYKRFKEDHFIQGMMKSVLIAAAAMLVALGQSVYAQHEGHKMPPAKPAASPAPAPSPQMPAEPADMNDHGHMDHGVFVMHDDQMFLRLGRSESNLVPMGRMGSGTSWQPATSPMPMMHKQSGEWLLMFHYNFVAGVNRQGGPRGVTKFESANWFMPSAVRRVGPGTLELRAMLSAEPFTFPPGGSPLLFQTGETYKGEPLIDRQHPHDLFMELSANYTVPVGERASWFVYAGYPGEPALGPNAFMHRASASENTSAPLSHHLQDSSHISFGVVTTGFNYRWFRLEGSVFNGREPDENRYNFEAHPWNSRSVRLQFAPNSNWSMQVSHGFLRNPEALEPGDVRRTTASISYNRAFERGNWASSLIWGRNHESHDGEIFNLNGYVAESTVKFLDRNYLYTRLELADKNQLLRAADRLSLGITDHHPSFRIGAYTAGGARDIWNTDKTSLAIGSDITFYSKPSILDPIYGSHPVSWKVFFRLRPAPMNMGAMHGTH